jgi:hypothetical protein
MHYELLLCPRVLQLVKNAHQVPLQEPKIDTCYSPAFPSLAAFLIPVCTIPFLYKGVSLKLHSQSFDVSPYSSLPQIGYDGMILIKIPNGERLTAKG